MKNALHFIIEVWKMSQFLVFKLAIVILLDMASETGKINTAVL